MTLGEHGALVVGSSSMTHVPGIAVRAVDTTGAGDAFNAGLAVALASGARLEDAAQFAVVTGGLAVTKEGVIPSLPYVKDIAEYYRHQGLAAPRWLAASAGVKE